MHVGTRSKTLLTIALTLAVATVGVPAASAGSEGATASGAVAANTLARAVARGVFEAKSLPGCPPSWRERHGK